MIPNLRDVRPDIRELVRNICHHKRDRAALQCLLSPLLLPGPVRLPALEELVLLKQPRPVLGMSMRSIPSHSIRTVFMNANGFSATSICLVLAARVANNPTQTGRPMLRHSDWEEPVVESVSESEGATGRGYRFGHSGISSPNKANRLARAGGYRFAPGFPAPTRPTDWRAPRGLPRRSRRALSAVPGGTRSAAGSSRSRGRFSHHSR